MAFRPWVNVDSSNVRRFRYDDASQLLEVTFIGKPRKSGGYDPDATYTYERVPDHLVEAFERAPSKGRFVWQFIRDQFDYSGPRFG